MLEPLKIIAFKDDKYSSQIGEYTLQINPENYSHNLNNTWENTKNTSGQSDLKYKSTDPETISFDFYMDATGVLAGSGDSRKKYAITGVMEEIDKLRKLAYTVNGEIHTPNFLILFWGTLKFKCRMNKLNVDYTLFKPSGIPLRAKVSAGFTGYMSPEEVNKLLNLSSPDLTHARTVFAGDTLPLMCHRIYGDSRYYLDVARVNGLVDFRNLTPGTQIIFPPLSA